jgi:hypothetical protein
MLQNRSLRLQKDHLAGALLVGIGCLVAWCGTTYRIGSLSEMGAGFVPVVLGTLMAFIGAIIALQARPAPEFLERSALVRNHVRSWVCILGSMAVFVVLGSYAGLVPAAFALVFLAAIADPQTTFIEAAILAAAIDLFGVLVFRYGLNLQFDLLTWN